MTTRYITPRQLDRLIERFTDRDFVERGLMVGADVLRDTARAIAPRRTGNLINNIVSQPDGASEEPGVLVYVDDGAFYGRFVIEGTNPARQTGRNRRKRRNVHGTRPNPIFDNALEQSESAAVNKTVSWFQRQVR